jgi:hypothetical protein
MLMINGNDASIETVRAVGTPAPTKTWTPVSHKQVVDSIMRNAENRGLTFDFEAVLNDGKLREGDGSSVPVPGARCAFQFLFHPHEDLQAPKGARFTLVGINTHDKSESLQFFAGGQVIVCSNGMRVGDIIVKRKHTAKLDITSHVDTVFAQFLTSSQSMPRMIEALEGHSITDDQAVRRIVDAADAGAIASSHILPVVREWREPSHEEFQPRNAWSLYNAHTEVMKKQSTTRQGEGFRALNEVFYPELGVAA